MELYTLLKSKRTGELHLFRSKKDSNGKCTAESNSICKKMKFADKESTVFACFDEQAARDACAAHGRAVCGICVSDLYADFDSLSEFL